MWLALLLAEGTTTARLDANKGEKLDINKGESLEE
jgi:hypothetical protein